MNRGDTACLLLDYQLNDEPLVEGAYREIELQINAQASIFSVKKLMSAGDILWRTVNYIKDGEDVQFTGYVAYLSQEESFKLLQGTAQVQLRVMLDTEVGSTACETIDIGKTLSKEVLNG